MLLLAYLFIVLKLTSIFFSIESYNLIRAYLRFFERYFFHIILVFTAINIKREMKVRKQHLTVFFSLLQKKINIYREMEHNKNIYI
jgi:hypothetical protein